MKTLSAAFLLSALSVHAADRVALVIGNDAYQHARPLQAAVNDAGAIGKALRGLDFEVIAAANAGVETMLEKLAELKQAARGASAVVVYYAGHGIESNGVNYLVPVDAKLEREIQLKTQTLSLDDILGELRSLRVPARMVILDCCRDNPLEGRSWLATRGSGGGLAALSQDTLAEATLVVYAASPGKPALDRVAGEAAHSPFTAALLEQLPKPGVHSFEMFGLVEDGVIERTGGRQAPRLFYNGSTQPFRNFRFAKGAVTPVPPPLTVAVPAPVMTVPEPPPPTPTPVVVQPSLPESGYFDLDTLFIDGPYAAYNTHSRTQILKQVQAKLKTAGYYSGNADGTPGPATQRAILSYQLAKALPVSNSLDQATLESLGLTSIEQMIPSLEQRVRELNEEVEALRRRQ